MLPGPVFQIELVTTARRWRYYATRVLHGTILLAVLWITYVDYVRSTAGVTSPTRLSQFAAAIFLNFAVVQSIAILVVTPTLLAGAIADETQRKTLHYLLASSLTSAEIVVGKLTARLLHVLLFIALGLPVVSLLGLLGGIDPLAVLLLDVGTLATAFFLAGISLLVSTFARRVRDAIVCTFLLEAVWLFLPPFVWTIQFSWRRAYSVIEPINRWLLATNPFSIIDAMERGRGGALAAFWRAFAWCCGLQIALGCLFIALAVWRLRPVFRKSGGDARRTSWSLRWRTRRARKRKQVSDDPMLWKETCTGGPSGILMAIVRIVALFAFLGIAYGLVYFGWPAARELYQHGYSWVARGQDRTEFNQFLRIIIMLLSIAWFLGVAVVSASSITSEREQDTWISLTSSFLTAPEIVWAKLIGAPWSLRALGQGILALAIIGLVAGAVHPLGFCLFLVLMGTFTWFTSALGTLVSLWSKTTTRALAFTIITLAITNGGYLFCCIPLRTQGGPWIASGCMPFPVYMSLLSYQDVWHILGFEHIWGPFGGTRRMEFLAAFAIAFTAYGSLALLLTVIATKDFDRISGRPRLAARPVAQPKTAAELR